MKKLAALALTLALLLCLCAPACLPRALATGVPAIEGDPFEKKDPIEKVDPAELKDPAEGKDPDEKKDPDVKKDPAPCTHTRKTETVDAIDPDGTRHISVHCYHCGKLLETLTSAPSPQEADAPASLGRYGALEAAPGMTDARFAFSSAQDDPTLTLTQYAGQLNITQKSPKALSIQLDDSSLTLAVSKVSKTFNRLSGTQGSALQIASGEVTIKDASAFAGEIILKGGADVTIRGNVGAKNIDIADDATLRLDDGIEMAGGVTGGGTLRVDDKKIAGDARPQGTPLSSTDGAQGAAFPPTVVSIGTGSVTLDGQQTPMGAPYLLGEEHVMLSSALLQCVYGSDLLITGKGVITLIASSSVYTLTAGSNVVRVNGERVMLSVPVATKNGEIFFPAEFLRNLLGIQTTWNGKTKTLTIN